MAKQRRTVGAVLVVPLDDTWHAYAWTMPEADFAFFDLRAESILPIDKVISQPIAFRVSVHKSAWTNGRWRKIGSVQPPLDKLAPVSKFIQDSISKKLSLYTGGDIRPATREECIGLECCAVWDPEHVEDRLRDHFAKLPNKWVKSMELDS